MKLKATYFDRVDNPQGEAIELDGLADIEELVTSKKAATKTELPLLKLATFKDNYRRNYNVDAISGIEVDYDAGQIAPWSAAEQLDQAGLNCLIVSTPSHNPTSGQNRWRGFFQTSTELAPSEHRKLVARVNGLFGGRLAPESFTLSQAYFIGSVENAEFPVESYLLDGDFIDLRDDLDAGAIYPPGDGPDKPGTSRASRGRADGHIAHTSDQVSLLKRPAVQIPVPRIKAMLADLDNTSDALDWNAWSKVGMAIRNSTGGSEDGYEAFREWSAHSPKHDDAHCRERWFHWGNSPSDFMDGQNLERIINKLNERVSIADQPLNQTGPGLSAMSAQEDVHAGTERKIRQQPRSLVLVKASDFVAAPPFDFVEDTFTDGGMSALYGASNTMKTFVALALWQAVGSGGKWLDLECAQGGAVYVAAEGGGAIKKRMDAMRVHGLSLDAPMAILPQGIDLLHLEPDTGLLIDALKQFEDDHGQPVRLLILDTLARVMAGGDENGPQDMGAVIGNIDRIRDETGAHVLALHHTGKDASRGERGHSSFRAALDTAIECKAIGEGYGVVSCTKQRDLEMWTDRGFRLQTHEVGENARGKPLVSGVVVPHKFAAQPDTNVKYTDNEKILKQILENVWSDPARRSQPRIWDVEGGTIRVSDSVSIEQAREWFYARAGQERDNLGVLRKYFRRAFKGLDNKNFLIVHKHELGRAGQQRDSNGTIF